MKLVVNAIIILLLGLIKIGDTVLFVFYAIARLLQVVFRFLRSVITETTQFIRSASTALKRLAISVLHFSQKLPTALSSRIHVRKPQFSLANPIAYSKSFLRRKPGRPKKQYEVQKTIVVSRFPFFSKLKYFIGGTMFSSVFIFLPLLFFIFLQDLPSPKELNLQQIAQTTKIYDRNDTLLYEIYANQNRTVVPLSEVPQNLKEATIAIEDKDFYNHPGFDATAIIRSALSDYSGRGFQGGSTLTQQLIKSALLTPETTISRKVKELIIAFWTERLYTKDQILELYFNQVPYGGTAWGVESAAQTYFGKHVREISLAESAFLAGIPQAPTSYSPYGENPTAWKKRQKDVLAKMRQLGYISAEEEKAAEAEELVFRKPQHPLHAPHFVMYVKDLLIKKYGIAAVERGGLIVKTTLDLKLNEQVQQIVSDQVDIDKNLLLSNGAAVVTNPSNGDILSMIGSHDFSDPNGGNVNIATSLRQPGSSIKIVTYTAALSDGFTAATILDDSPVGFPSYPGGPTYSPVNYDGRSHGRVPLRLAFGNSFNITAVRTLNQIGVLKMVNLAKKMGVKSWGDPSRYGLSITLGAAETTMLDMATVFGTMANLGDRVDVNPFLKVTDSKGNILEEKQEIQKTKVVDPGIAFIVSNILADNSARSLSFGPNSLLNIPGKTVSVKTGTSDNKRDNWTIGYTPDRLVTVWVGNNDNSPMSPTLASGVTGAAPIWNKIMTLLLSSIPDHKLQMPSNVIYKPCLGYNEYFIKGTENSVGCVRLPIPSASPTPR